MTALAWKSSPHDRRSRKLGGNGPNYRQVLGELGPLYAIASGYDDRPGEFSVEVHGQFDGGHDRRCVACASLEDAQLQGERLMREWFLELAAKLSPNGEVKSAPRIATEALS